MSLQDLIVQDKQPTQSLLTPTSDTFVPVCFGPGFVSGGELVPDGLDASRGDSVMLLAQADMFSRVDLYASGGDSVTNTTENTQPMTSLIYMMFAKLTRVTRTTEKYGLLLDLQI